jgi:hypothetical protein
MPQYLTKSLEVDVVDPATFVRRLETPFLEKQTDEWLVKLYIFLSKLQGFGLTTIIKGKPILRLEDNSHRLTFESPTYTLHEETRNQDIKRNSGESIK